MGRRTRVIMEGGRDGRECLICLSFRCHCPTYFSLSSIRLYVLCLVLSLYSTESYYLYNHAIRRSIFSPFIYVHGVRATRLHWRLLCFFFSYINIINTYLPLSSSPLVLPTISSSHPCKITRKSLNSFPQKIY